MAHIVFITAGEYSDRKTVALCVCVDEQVAEAVKVEVEQEIRRIEEIAAIDDEYPAIEVVDGVVVMPRWTTGHDPDPVRGLLATPRMDGFYWRPCAPGAYRYGGEVEVVIVEVPSIGL